MGGIEAIGGAAAASFGGGIDSAGPLTMAAGPQGPGPAGSVPIAEAQPLQAASTIDRMPAASAAQPLGSQVMGGLRTLHDNVAALQADMAKAASTTGLRTSHSMVRTAALPGPAVLGSASLEAHGATPRPPESGDPMRDYMAASAEQRAITLKTAIHALTIDVAHSTATSVKSAVDKLLQG